MVFGHRGGLLEDLLEHEVRVAAALDLREIPVDALTGLSCSAESRSRMLVAVAREHGDFAIVEVDHLARVREDGRGVGGEVVLAVAHPTSSGLPLRAATILSGSLAEITAMP
jgi:hypothetical protein